MNIWFFLVLMVNITTTKSDLLRLGTLLRSMLSIWALINETTLEGEINHKSKNNCNANLQDVPFAE